MANARLIWIGYFGKSSFAHADVLKRLRQRHVVDFCAAVGVKPNQGDDVVLDLFHTMMRFLRGIRDSKAILMLKLIDDRTNSFRLSKAKL